MLKEKFRGCLLGALIGDCLGANFEFRNFTLNDVQRHIDDAENDKGANLMYTDDTQMTQELANALLDKRQIDYTDLARRFTERYYKDGAFAGYGGNVIDVFRKLTESDYKAPLQPAREQFNGSGSYGNGAAMRVAPVALYSYPDLEHTAEVANQSSLVTHTHEQGRHGAIFQAVSIRLCLLSRKISDVNNFLNELERDLKTVDICDEYLKALNEIKNLLAKEKVVDTQVEIKLGNDVSALRSVPTALFSFLYSLKPIDGITTTNGFRRAVEYAISLGGDTDTIASMAGALAGAYYGRSAINENIIKSCPDHDVAIGQADAFFDSTLKGASTT